MDNGAEQQEPKPEMLLMDSIEALGIVDQMPGCDAISFGFGMMHGICMAMQFPEWAQSFYLKHYPTEKAEATWRREHGKIVELTPMAAENSPNPTGQ